MGSNPDDDYFLRENIKHDMETISSIQIFIAIISMMATSSVVFILLLKYNKLVKQRRFIHYIGIIAISDTIISLCYSFGYPEHFLCSFQSFISIFFQRCSWVFTDLLVIQLTYVVVYKRFCFETENIHKIFWPINILLQLLPFSTQTWYGSKGFLPYGVSVCTYYNNNGDYGSAALWLDLTVNYIQNISFFTISLCSIFIFVYTRYLRSKDPLLIMTNVIDNEVWHTIILYPLSMLFAYAPSCIYSIVFEEYTTRTGNYPNNGWLINNALSLLNPLYGFILTLVFYYKNDDARQEWISLIQRMRGYNNDNIGKTRELSDESDFQVKRIGNTSAWKATTITASSSSSPSSSIAETGV